MTRLRGDRGVSASTSSVTLTFACHIRKAHRGRKRLRQGPRPEPPKAEQGRIPRISRLMALALHLDQLIQSGALRDFAEAARLGHVSRARISQIMDLLNLAPAIQERILCLPYTVEGKDAVTERQVRQVLTVQDWPHQRDLWRGLVDGASTISSA